MKRILTILILLLFYKNIHGQKTILITKDRENYYEEYSALQSDKKIKHGYYSKFSKPLMGGFSIESVGDYSNGLKNGLWKTYYRDINNIKDKGFYKNDIRDSIWVFFYPEGIPRKLEEVQADEGILIQIVDANPVVSKTGKYKNGRLIGVWEFFDKNGEINQRYNYDSYALVYLSREDIENCEVGFIGGESLMYQYLYEHFDFEGLMNSISNKIKLETGSIIYKFVIDENGSVKNITEVTKTISNKKINEQAFETIQSMDKQWYPKRVDGNAQSSEKTITFELIAEFKTSFYNSSDGRFNSSKTSMGFGLKIKVD